MTHQPAQDPSHQEPVRQRRSFLVLLPLVVFGGLATIFLTQLISGHDPQALPSALIGQAAPETRLPPLEGLKGPDGAPLPGIAIGAGGDGRFRLVNVFASWCVPCRQEHPMLMRMASDKRLEIVGINYKDTRANALGFLTDLGNPYDAVGVDPAGRSTIDWGVYGVPETFLVGPDGKILWKQTGPITEESLRSGLLPAMEKASAPPMG